MSAERVKLSEYITHLQGIIEKYGDIYLSDGNGCGSNVFRRSYINGDFWGSNGPEKISKFMVTPKNKRASWRDGGYFEKEDVGKYFYFIGSDD